QPTLRYNQTQIGYSFRLYAFMHCKSSCPVSQVISVCSRGRIGYSLPQWRRLIVLCLCLVTACRSAGSETDAVALPLAESLPVSWAALRDVEEVNIDGDDATEYLLLFTYDASGIATTRDFFSSSSQAVGPVGAIIYDAQVVTGTITM